MADIIHQFVVTSNPENVFDAFCLPQNLNAWWTLEASGKPELNSEYRFYFGPEYDWRARVIAVEPGKSLTWQMTQAMDDWMPTQMGFDLHKNENRTIVHFFHRNWKEANDHFAISNFCWGQLLSGLKKYVEQGEIIPFEKRS